MGEGGFVIWKLAHREVRFPRRTLVMGIVNVNDDSFSGDGTLEIDQVLEVARRQVESGADVVDIGAESAGTQRGAIPVAEELRRFGGFFERWPEVVAGLSPKDEGQLWPPVVSANTWRPAVVREVLGMGVELLNDMGGLPDPINAELCAEHGTSLLIMHSVGEPKVAHLEQQWSDVMGSMRQFFEQKIQLAEQAGMRREALVLDPGIDFAKQREDNLKVYHDLEELQCFGRPLLVPVSRKTVIGEVLELPNPRQRDAGTVACISAAVRRGAHIVRVHNVSAAWQVIKVLDELV